MKELHLKSLQYPHLKITCKDRVGKKLRKVVCFALGYNAKFCNSMKKKNPSLLKQASLHKRESLIQKKILMLCSFPSDNKVGNLLGLTLKVSGHCIHETAHYSSRWLLLTTSLSHLHFTIPLVLQSSTAHLTDKDQNAILKW